MKKLTEADIQSLKAQEAKDLAVDLLHELQAKEKGPLSTAEVQLKELEFQLRLREAESEDNRRREAHERQIKELELHIQQERVRCEEAESRANEVREAFANVVDRVTKTNESLSLQLERATREHNLKIEQLEVTSAARQTELTGQLQALEEQRNALHEEISQLAALQSDAQEVGRLCQEIDHRKKEFQSEQAQLEEQVAAAEFEKTKRISAAKRSQELSLAQLDAQHQKEVLQRNRQAADAILESLEMRAVTSADWNQLQHDLQAVRQRGEQEIIQLREQAREELRREYNITRSDPLDVTELYYREQAGRAELERLRTHVDKLDTEIRRMRGHIEQEPQRIAAAVEAAKTQVQNYIEQAGKR